MAAVIKRVVVGFMEVNCYIFADDESKEAVIIDPGDEHEKIRNEIEKLSAAPRFVINTHGHADHIGANGRFNLPVLIHKLDADFLLDPKKNLSADFFIDISSPGASRLLEDGEKIDVGELQLEVVHTPGHTPGSICLLGGGVLFTGDTLFCEGIGRTDIPLASEKELMRSLREKIFALDDDIKIYPGHGAASTIGHERKHNPFL